jgi:Haem-binding domain
MNMSKLFKIAAAVGLLALVVMQFFRPARTNPTSDPSVSFEAVVKPPQEVVSSLKRACNDCHSNQTVWPWYSNIAPVSWLVASDVNEGRVHLNFSNWMQPGAVGEKPEVSELCEQVKVGKMPLRAYTLLHPQAKLTDLEVAGLCALPAGEAQAEVAEPR